MVTKNFGNGADKHWINDIEISMLLIMQKKIGSNAAKKKYFSLTVYMPTG